MSLLSLSKVRAGYGPSQVLFGVDLEVAPGEAVALMGRNGMGKTTTIKALCGMLPITAGTIQFDGRDIAALPSHKVARLGIGLVPEGRRCFAPLTVAENLIAVAQPGPWDQDRVADLFPRLGERWQQKAGSLSGGEQQMLAIARALVTNPRLLILDEATEGLAPLIRQEIWSVIARLKAEEGLALLVVDKSIKELQAVVDHAVILQRGETVWAGALGDLGADLQARYLGL